MNAKKLARQQRAVERWQVRIEVLNAEIVKHTRQMKNKSCDPATYKVLEDNLRFLNASLLRAHESLANTQANIHNLRRPAVQQAQEYYVSQDKR